MAEISNRFALLTPREMSSADQAAVAAGIPGIVLMENAGRAVADAVRKAFPAVRRIAVWAGPGNNGGDAYVAARYLSEEPSLEVVLFTLAAPSGLSGDAAIAAQGWHGAVKPLDECDPRAFDVVIDGLFDAGLGRPITGGAKEAIARLNSADTPAVAIDLPSGVFGTSGEILGAAVEASLTVTFFRKKPGHLLQPGKELCGKLLVADIGIPVGVLSSIGARAFESDPLWWRSAAKTPSATGHKYDRGHAVVFSGGASRTGAARLSAIAALRAGAGLVTLFSPASAMLVNAGALTAVMLKRCDDERDLAAHLDDERLNAFALGPGFGVGEKAKAFALAILGAGRCLVLDADGITSFAGEPTELFQAASASNGELVLTPHAGEFKKLFPEIAGDSALSKLEKARAAASLSGAVVLLKGADTVIAAPDGRAAINTTGTPWLATAGSGDVLTGMIAGLLANGGEAFECAAAGAWMHGKAAEILGPGLIAEDLPTALPRVHSMLVEQPSSE
ncbi:NAD(P)H-hydrate dehydratase [Consotaella salsifontis]|uniref:Bifunctional NAD(P)H-hydrate repair enzyme n=1 Tax=Consotaella salsifontis TaxID=1365950 RepID=A0A1T4LSQ5_9HYPH|nr:NAD(P)H-hydrate dehydratase [Consotaella salsifontis]SJZ57743.1 NAD(P)H-hydrate epimerase [Consotaella salsifontis]